VRWLPYQWRWIFDLASAVASVKSRQVGMSEAEVFKRSARALGYRWLYRAGPEGKVFPGIPQNFISASERQSIDLLRRAAIHVEALSIGATGRSAITHANAHEIVLANGTRLRAFAPNPRTIRSVNGDVTLDEFAANPHADAVWKVVFPMVMANLANPTGGWQLSVISTPEGDSNLFHALMRESRFAHVSRHEITIQRAVSEGFPLPKPLEQMRAEFGDEDAWTQEFECFPPGTMVATPRGHVPIEQLRAGESVLTHRGRWRPVTATMCRGHSGELLQVQAFGSRDPVLCTPEHPFLVHDRSSQTRQWKRAAELTTEDCLILPKVTGSMAGVITSEMAQLIAWYICEGTASGNSVSFALNPKNEVEIAKVRALLEGLGYPCRWFGAKQSGALYVNSVGLADTLSAWCGSGAANKRIPFDLIRGHEKIFFDTMIAGDGCVVVRERPGDGKSSKRFAFTTVSRGLAFDMQHLAATLGRRAGIQAREAADSVILGRTVHCRRSYLVQITVGFQLDHGRHRHDAFPTKLGIAYRVRGIKRVAYDGPVYNLSVKQDESYVVEGRAVHNCNFLASNMRYISADLWDDACVDEDEVPDLWGASSRCFGGYDVGRHHDAAAYGEVAYHDERLWQNGLVEYEHKMPFDDQVNWISKKIGAGATRVAIDAGGMGEPQAERLVNLHRSRIEPVKFTLESKAELASGLRLTLERGGAGKRMFRPRRDDLQLRKEVLLMRRIVTKTNNIRFDIERQKGSHGDGAWAIALAIHASGMAAKRTEAITPHALVPRGQGADLRAPARPIPRPKRGAWQ